jgi:hypothetical protein
VRWGVREGKPDEQRWAHREAQAEPGSREDRGRLIEQRAESLRGAGAMRRAQRREADLQLLVSHVDVAAGGEDLVQQCSAFLLGALVVR